MNFLQNKHILFIFVLAIAASSCVKKKDFLALQGNRDAIKTSLEDSQKRVEDLEMEAVECKKTIQGLESTIANQKNELGGKENALLSLKGDIDEQKAKNEAFLKGLSDLSLLSESESKQLKETLASMEGIPSGKARKDSASLALVSNLKKSLGDDPRGDVQIVSKGSVVYISLSDKVLFDPGRSALNESSKYFLSRVAKVLQDFQEIDVLVEGHTDADPIAFTSNRDNWDLSSKRAVAVVRALQQDYEVNPARLVPSARAEFKPKADNETPEGKKMNRRTEIILVPRIDQYLRLITGK